jgi:hypothetical protein
LRGAVFSTHGGFYTGTRGACQWEKKFAKARGREVVRFFSRRRPWLHGRQTVLCKYAYKIARQFFRSACTALKKIATVGRARDCSGNPAARQREELERKAGFFFGAAEKKGAHLAGV